MADYALQFDGSQNYIDLGTMGNFGSHLGNGFYCKFDIKTTQTTIGEFGGYFGATATVFGIMFNEDRFNGNTSGLLGFYIFDDNGNGLLAQTTSATNFNDGNRHTIVITANPSSNTITISVDGALQAVTYRFQQTPATFSNFSSSLYIGAHNESGANKFLACILDNLRIGTSSSVLYGNYSFNEGNQTLQPTNNILDNFNRANASTLGGNWTYFTKVAGDQGIISNQAYNPGSAFSNYTGMMWNPTGFNADVENFITITTIPTMGSSDDGPSLDVQIIQPGTNYESYHFGVRGKTGGILWNIGKAVNGTESDLATATATLASGDKMWLRKLGNVITGYWWNHANSLWTQVVQARDDTYDGVAGNIGFYIPGNNVDGRMDDFGGGNISGGLGTTTSDSSGNGNTGILTGSPIPTWVIITDGIGTNPSDYEQYDEKLALRTHMSLTNANFSVYDLRKLFYARDNKMVSQNDAIRAYLQSQLSLTTVQSLSDLWRLFFISKGVTNQVSLSDMAKDFFTNIGF